MVRIQLHLTADQDRALRSLGRARGLSRAELIRAAIDSMLLQSNAGKDSLEELIGSAGPGPAQDLSTRHDELLYSRAEIPLPRTGERPPRLRKR